MIKALQRAKASHPTLRITMEATVRHTEAFYRLGDQNARVPRKRQYTTFWTLAKGRIHSHYEAQRISEGADGKSRLDTASVEAIWDGKKETVMETDSGASGSQTVRVYAVPSNRPYPLGRVLGGVWLADIVNATEFRAVGLPADAGFGRLVAVEGRSGGLTRRFVLAPERGWLAIRVEELRPKGGTTRLELAAAEKHGRCWIGTSARLSWLEDVSGVQTPITEVTFRVTELKVGTAVGDSLFRLPRLREGAVVLDHRSGRIYGVGARGEWLDQGVLGDTSQQGGAP